MRRLAFREAVRLALIVALAAGGISYWLLDAPFGALTHHTVTRDATLAKRSPTGTPTRRARSPAPAHPRAVIAPDPLASPADKATGGAGRRLGFAARLVHWLLGALAVAGLLAFVAACAALGLAGPRLRARAARAARRERYEIIPYRTDVASPERMVQVYQALAATLNRRWFRRILTGAPSVAFEVHVLPQRNRPAHVVLSVVCSPEDVLLVDSCLQIAYPDVRVGYEFTVDPRPAADRPTWTEHVKRLKKLRPFITQVGDDGHDGRAFEHQLIDSLLVNLAQVKAPVTVQLSLTPVPRWVDRLAGRAYHSEERRVAGGRDRGELGERSPRADAELRGGLAAQHQLLFYFDVRCASNDARVALLAAQALSQGGGANRLRVKEPWLLEQIHARRIEKAVPRLLAPIRHGVLSTRELAVLWQLPTRRPKSVTVRRSNLLREPASAAVWRPKDPADAFAEDERGPVGIRPADRKLGVRFTGVPGVGKTSGMVALWRSDAHDRDAVLIGLDPKTEAAEEMLSQVPADRKVYFLNFARPEFGMSPLLMPASMEVIGDTIVESLRDINEDGAIMAASDRYLRSATYGALLLAKDQDKMPSWYDVYQQLWPEDTGAELRRQVSELCQADPDLAGLRALWGTILPSMLKESRSQVTVRMDAPGNKLARLLGQPTLARMLHHPVQVSIDQIIEERSVLIVQGSMGEIGEENAVIMLRFLLRMIHTALQREQQKPAHLRARKCVYLDEAHYLWGGVLEVMLSTGRSAGLEPTLAWQHSGQIEEQRMAKGVLADLQTAISFRCGDPEEAEMVARQAMIAYLTRYSGEQSDRDNARITPAEQLKLSRHFGLVNPIVDGQADKPYYLRTKPMRKDIERIEHHLQAQRSRGFHYPDSMPDPLPNTKASSEGDDGAVPATTASPEPEREKVASNTKNPRRAPAATPTEGEDRRGDDIPGADPVPAAAHEAEPSTEAYKELTGAADPSAQQSTSHAEGTSGSNAVTQRALPAPSTPAPAAEPSDTSQSQPPPSAPASPPRRPPPPVRHQPQAPGAQDSGPQAPPLPASYTELELGDVRQIVWDRPQVLAPPPGQQPKWKPDEVRALTMLHRFGPLMTTQIGRVIWPDRTERTVQRRMEALHKYGLVNRFRMATNLRHPFIYTLTEEGFRIAKDGPNEDGRNYLDPTVKFSAPNGEIPDPKPADAKWRESELRSGLYVLHNLHAAGWALTAGALLGDAAKRVHGGRESSCAIRPPRGIETRDDVAMQGNRSVGDLQLERFQAIWADARLDVHVRGHHMTHWYVECDRTGRPSKNSRKFAAYDAMFNGWGQMLSGYQQRLPIVVFVCLDERSVLAHLVAADREMTGWVAGLVGKLEDRVYVGRQRTWFVCERDVHQGSLRAWRLPDLPPTARKALGYPEKMRPVIKELVPAERLRSNPMRRAAPGRRRSAA
jgi:protein involved in plasmid replication-relaxation